VYPATGWVSQTRRERTGQRLAQKFIVVRMTANPEPEHAIRNLNAECTEGKPDAGGPVTADFLEM